jgi:hypothetical protein
MLASHADLARQLAALERKYGAQFRVVFQAIRELMEPPDLPPKKMGFHGPSVERAPWNYRTTSRPRGRRVIADTYHAWQGDTDTVGYANVPGSGKSATPEEVREHGHVLTPGRHVGVDAQ